MCLCSDAAMPLILPACVFYQTDHSGAGQYEHWYYNIFSDIDQCQCSSRHAFNSASTALFCFGFVLSSELKHEEKKRKQKVNRSFRNWVIYRQILLFSSTRKDTRISTSLLTQLLIVALSALWPLDWIKAVVPLLKAYMCWKFNKTLFLLQFLFHLFAF